MRVLVLGGTGFLGRHVAAALTARGHDAVIASRRAATDRRECRFERRTHAGSWADVLADVDAVVNCVGILRARGRETYERVHHLAPAALAADCARRGLRLIHVSALGLHADARSGFIRSKLAGEEALRASGADYTIVRPSLLDGEGGFGARWLRALSRWRWHAVPADAGGRIAVLAVEDAASAIARLCELGGTECREADLGGLEGRTLAEHLAALRARHRSDTPRIVRVPALLARLASHACDLVHVSPFSFGHLELLRRDNVPRVNALPWLLGAPPRRIRSDRETASARGRAILPPSAVRDGGSTRTAPAR
jgi:NADH dehydrogenase